MIKDYERMLANVKEVRDPDVDDADVDADADDDELQNDGDVAENP